MMLQKRLLIRCLEGSDNRGFFLILIRISLLLVTCVLCILFLLAKDTYEIPPAIIDRMLYKMMAYIYPYIPKDETSGTVAGIVDIGLAKNH